MEPYDPKKRYCGPGKGFVAWLVPERWFGVCLNRPCYNHDYGYERGGTGKDRLDRDNEFRDEVLAEFAKAWWVPFAIGNWIAQRYFKAVRILGSASFNYRAVLDERFVKLVKVGKILVTSVKIYGKPPYTSQSVNESRLAEFQDALRPAEAALAEGERKGE